MSEEGVDFGVFGGVESGEFLSAGVEEDDGGEAVDVVFFDDGGVLFFDVLEFLVAGHVDFDEDVVFGGGFDEFLFGEDFLAHHDAWGAPIGAGEFDEDGFVFLFGGFEGFFEVGGPAFEGVSEGGGGEGGDADGHGGEPGDRFHDVYRRLERAVYFKNLGRMWKWG